MAKLFKTPGSCRYESFVMSSTPPGGASVSFGNTFAILATTWNYNFMSHNAKLICQECNIYSRRDRKNDIFLTSKLHAKTWQKDRQLTVFPFVVCTWTSSPLILTTSPSIHANPGSSIQTWEPTIILTGPTYVISRLNVWGT